jgi:serine phosphatase RsbU (regulator of sigma subunit)
LEDRILIAAVDCTGHGVPGAFMSIVGHNQLNFVVNVKGIRKPSEILHELNYGVTHVLKQTSGVTSVRDGMDLALLSIHKDKNLVEFAGAYNPLVVVRDGEIIQFKGDKHPIGTFIDKELLPFTNHELEIQEGDTLYIFSDGYVDQFGGDKGRKFMIKNFKRLLLQASEKPMNEQKALLEESLQTWRENYPQIDDILVIGIQV